jgi:TonB family protein
MRDFAIYSLQANALLILSYALYRLLLSNESYFRVNRVYIIASAIISLTVPLLKFQSLVNSSILKINLDEVVVYQFNSVSSTSHTLANSLLQIVYITGIVIMMALFIKNLIQITMLIIKGRAVKERGYTLIRSAKANSIFSFLTYIIVPVDKDYNENEIMVHEMTHVKQLHSLDGLFFELLSVFFWYNPICYLYKVSIKETHEFLADNAVVKDKSNLAEYAKLITSHALDIAPAYLSNNFISTSFLKRRITMLVKQPTAKGKFIARYGIACLLLVTMAAFTPLLHGRNVIPGKISEEPVYAKVDIMPVFKSGLAEFLQQNITYPKSAKDKGVEGAVVVSFIISAEGKVKNVHVLKSPDKDLSAEAIRVVRLMPDWQPAQKDGKNVSTQFNLPIRFQLK